MTAAVRVSSLNWRMGFSFSENGQVYYQKPPMRLVTFTAGNSPPRTGALIDGDRKVLDLQAAYGRTYHGSSPLLESMMHIIEAGDAALDTIGQLLKAPAAARAFTRDEVRLLAPVPHAAADARLPVLREAPAAGFRGRGEAARHRGAHPEGLVRAADLLPPEPLLGVRHGCRRAVAEL